MAALGVAGCTKAPEPPFPELRQPVRRATLAWRRVGRLPIRSASNLQFYIDWLSESGRFPVADLMAWARSFEPVLADHLPDILEEIDGIARGAGLSLDEVLLINARTDIRAIVKAELAADAVPGCTALALTGTVDGRRTLALSQNWDWSPALADAPVVLRLRPDRGPALVTLVEAGMTGKIGFNEHRLGVCLNFLSHTSDGRPGEVGVPIHCLLRAAMDCHDLDEFVALIRSVPRSASANFLLAQRRR